MVLTKTQILNFLDNKKQTAPHGATASDMSMKYISMGAFKILISKDIITPADVEAEFPELGL